MWQNLCLFIISIFIANGERALLNLLSISYLFFVLSSRREARIKENYDRISAALAARDSRGTNKTRIIPDVPGKVSLLYGVDCDFLL